MPLHSRRLKPLPGAMHMGVVLALWVLMPAAGSLQAQHVRPPATDTSISINEKKERYAENDTLVYDLRLVRDAEKQPVHYYTHLLTSVCITGKCRLVAVQLYWDLAGEFIRYELPEGKILTKGEHEPFTREDYQKLDQILRNKYWPLADYPVEALVVENTAPAKAGKRTPPGGEVDGYSGATAKFISEADNIPGALYTVYTLYRFVHNPSLVARLTETTKTLLNPALAHRMLASGSGKQQELALHFLQTSGRYDPKNHPLLLALVPDHNPQLSALALQILNATDAATQHDLLALLPRVSDRMQTAIVDKLCQVTVDPALLRQAALELSRIGKYHHYTVLLRLIGKQSDFSGPVLDALLALLAHPNPYFAREAFRTLSTRPINDPAAKTKIEAYRNSAKTDL